MVTDPRPGQRMNNEKTTEPVPLGLRVLMWVCIVIATLLVAVSAWLLYYPEGK